MPASATKQIPAALIRARQFVLRESTGRIYERTGLQPLNLLPCQPTKKAPASKSGSICQRASGTTPQHSSPPDSGGAPLPAMKLHGELRSRRQRILRGGRQSVTHSSHGSKAEYNSDSLHFLLFSFLVPCRGTRLRHSTPFTREVNPKIANFIFLSKK